MSKTLIFGVLIAWLLVATYVFSAFGTYLTTDEFEVENGISELEYDEDDSNLDKAWELAKTFFALILFDVQGLPVIVTLLFFTLPTFVFAFMLFDTVIG